MTPKGPEKLAEGAKDAPEAATNWDAYPRQVLAWLIMDMQLPISGSPTRQLKSTLVEALERYEGQCSRSDKERVRAIPFAMRHMVERILAEYREKQSKPNSGPRL